MRKPRGLSVVIAGCARDCEPYLAGVLENVDRIRSLYTQSALVLVEDGSADGTRRILLDYLQQAGSGHLLDGDPSTSSSRTVRLAAARNLYLDFIAGSDYRSFDHLIVLDCDDVNAGPLDLEALTTALEFLERDDRTMAVFANSAPAYFDIWALRHEEWCPGDCWAEVRANSHRGYQAALEQFVYARQLSIPSSSPPIPVRSAFGGFGIYKLQPALAGRYEGLAADGSDVCEHVAFNLALGTHGTLYIHPGLRNFAPQDRLRQVEEVDARIMRLEQAGREVDLVAPADHLLDAYRASYPLYDRRLPTLAGLLSEIDPGAALVDVGANIGDTVALCRLAGFSGPILAIEPSRRYFAILDINRRRRPDLFENVRALNVAVGRPNQHIVLREHHGTAEVHSGSAAIPGSSDSYPTVTLDAITTGPASLLKLDTDGLDAVILECSLEFVRTTLPVIWTETELHDSSDLARWQRLLESLADSHPFICVFDNFGFLIAHGLTAEKKSTVIDLLSYAFRHKRRPPPESGEPRIYYLDLALFPARHADLYQKFVATIPESDAGDAR